MANNAAAARARRKLKAEGGKRLSSISVPDPETWTEILHEENVLPFWREGKELTEAQLRDATEKLISEMCHDRRRAKAEEMLQQTANIRTGLIEREPAPDADEPPALFWKPTVGGHWSFRSREKKDKGRTFTEEEIEPFLEKRTDLHEEFAEAKGMQDAGITIIGE